MGIDSDFPSLSSLANDHGIWLESAERSSDRDDLPINLWDACWMAKGNVPEERQTQAVEYLRTLDLFLRLKILSRQSEGELWGRISKSNKGGFLSTVCEAAWGLYFKRSGIPFEYEASLPTSGRHSKNADFKIVDERGPIWLDVVAPDSTQAHGDKEPTYALSLDGAVERVGKKGINKYNNKFKEDIDPAWLKSESVGVLVGLSKIEQSVISSAISPLAEGLRIFPPKWLFSPEDYGLKLMWGFKLMRATKGAHLEPALVFPWEHPTVELKQYGWMRPEQLKIEFAPCPYSDEQITRMIALHSKKWPARWS